VIRLLAVDPGRDADQPGPEAGPQGRRGRAARRGRRRAGGGLHRAAVPGGAAVGAESWSWSPADLLPGRAGPHARRRHAAGPRRAARPRDGGCPALPRARPARAGVPRRRAHRGPRPAGGAGVRAPLGDDRQRGRGRRHGDGGDDPQARDRGRARWWWSACSPRSATRWAGRLYVATSLPGYIEITNPDADKRQALAWLCARFGIPHGATRGGRRRPQRPAHDRVGGDGLRRGRRRAGGRGRGARPRRGEAGGQEASQSSWRH